MNLEPNFETYEINNTINKFGNKKAFIQFLQQNILEFLHCEQRKDMIIGEQYYIGNHDILKRKH